MQPEEAQPGGPEAAQEEAPITGAREGRSRKKKSRWGAETELGLKVLSGEEVVAEEPQKADENKADEVQEPASKKRRSRCVLTAGASRLLLQQ